MKLTDITLADVSIETKVETLGVVLDQKLSEIDAQVYTVSKLIGPQGPKGEKGDKGVQGEQGIAGKDGVAGKDGKDGKDGVDGKDGEDGAKIVDIEVAIDDTLLIVLSDGTELKTSTAIVGPAGPRGATGAPGRDGTSGGTSGLSNPVFTYTDGLLTSILYGGGQTKTFTYTDGLLTQLDYNEGATTVRKTFNYTEGVLSSITQVTL